MRFNGAKNEHMERLASLIAHNKTGNLDTQLDKLRMIGIYIDEYRTIHEFPNGATIMEFDSDGLVDYFDEWDLGYYRKTYKIYGLGEQIEKYNFSRILKHPYGLFEAICKIQHIDYVDFMEATLPDGTNGLINTSYYKALIIDDKGNIILNELDNDCNQFGVNNDWIHDGLCRLYAPIIEHINHSSPEHIEYSDIEYERVLVGNKDKYHSNRTNTLIFPRYKNSKNNKYQLAFIGELSYKNENFAYALLDLETGKSIASAVGIKPIVITASLIGLAYKLNNEYSLLVLDLENDKVVYMEEDISCLEYLSWEGVYDEESARIHLKKEAEEEAKALSLEEKIKERLKEQ